MEFKAHSNPLLVLAALFRRNREGCRGGCCEIERDFRLFTQPHNMPGDMKKRQSITDLARELRNTPTESEQILWEIIKKRRLNGLRFVRQKPIIYESDRKRQFFFIADFYCAEKKLIVEVDGPIHNYQKFKDYQRDLVLKELVLRTLRIKNEELRDLKAVREKILAAL